MRTGLTGHEALDKTGITHMNGRLYDPAIGRFLNADPFVQSPGFSQSHNRYSYVMNSPTGFTDPSGYSCVGIPGERTCGYDDPSPFPTSRRWVPRSYGNSWRTYQNMLDYESAHKSRIMGYQVAASERVQVVIKEPWQIPNVSPAETKKVSGDEDRRMRKESPYKSIGVKRAVKKEIEKILKNKVFREEEQRVWEASKNIFRELGVLRVYENDGVYEVHSVGTPDENVANRISVPSPDSSMGRHVVDWHPHTGYKKYRPSPLPSPTDLQTSHRFGVPSVIRYGDKIRMTTIYQGGCKRGASC